MNFEFHIEELVLHGFAQGDRHGIRAALEGELTRLFAEQGISHSLRRGGEIVQWDGGVFPLSPHSGAQAIGSQVAKTMYQAMDRPVSSQRNTMRGE
jgi:hypothetical protein